MDKKKFYNARNLKTNLYLSKKIGELSCFVVISKEASKTKSGQILALSLANQLSRLISKIHFIFEGDTSNKLLVNNPIEKKTTFEETLIGTCKKIDPYGVFNVSCSNDPARSLSIGKTVLKSSIYASINNNLAIVDLDDTNINKNFDDNSKTSSALCSCIATSALLRRLLKLHIRPISVCSITFLETTAIIDLPTELQINIGRSLIIGAGAVGSNFSYWLGILGFSGDPTFLDGDIVKLHNTNRSLLFEANDSLEYSKENTFKVATIKRYLKTRCDIIPEFYDEAKLIENVKFDSIVCLANEFEIRTKILARYPYLLLQATTGLDWFSQFHRHFCQTDDCINCRNGDIKPISFGCSSSNVELVNASNNESNDFALPFLSAISSLMLYSYFARIELGIKNLSENNDIVFYSDFRERASRKRNHTCNSNCSYKPKKKLLVKYHSDNFFLKKDISV